MWLDWFDCEDDSRYWVSQISRFRTKKVSLISLRSVNLRLPHTPRSFPQAAAAHYFDDIFSKKGKTKTSAPTLRRSSTTRSIGNRSSVASINGDGAESAEEAIPDETASNGVGGGDHENTRNQLEHDEHVQRYVADQLERVRSGGSASSVHDEFEAQLDGA